MEVSGEAPKARRLWGLPIASGLWLLAAGVAWTRSSGKGTEGAAGLLGTVFAASSKDELTFELHNYYTERTKKPIGEAYPWVSKYKLAEPHRECRLIVTGAYALKSDYLFEWKIDGHPEVEGRKVSHMFNTTGEVEVKVKAESQGSEDHKATITEKVWVKYVRRELRSLTDTDRMHYFDAVEVIFKTPCDDGKRAYGSDFECIETFTAVHNNYAGDPHCDHAHDGYGFLTTHAALSVWFEKALQAVHPALSLPYWDYTIEMHSVYTARGDISKWRESEVWGDDWFGPAAPEGHVVDSGRFAYQPITVHGENKSLFTNSYGMMRAPWNQNRAEYVTRSNETYGFTLTDMPGCASHHTVMQYENFSDFGFHILYNPHGTTHLAIGGVWHADWHSKLIAVGYDMSVAPSWTLLGFAKQKNMFRAGYMSCPGFCSLDTNMSDCKCTCTDYDEQVSSGEYHTILDIIMLGYESYLYDRFGNDVSETIYGLLCNHDDDLYGVMGDSLESASPADASFWPTHPTVDRLFTWRRLLGMELTWPANSSWSVEGTHVGYCRGHDEDDIILVQNLFGNSTRPYSNKEILAELDPADSKSPYIYDNFEWPHCVSEGYSIDLMVHTGLPDGNIKL